MKLTVKILDQSGIVRAAESGENQAHLCYNSAYEPGDVLCIESDVPTCFLMIHPEDSMPAAFVFLTDGSYAMPVPFGEARKAYSPKSFTGDCHLLTVRTATTDELCAYKNVAFNPYDCHENTVLFPHVSANVETRDEAVFAARNAIDGNTANYGHGAWPFESWGINQQENAELRVDFGRVVRLNQAVITLRADFPHDNWWEQATLRFSDGMEEILHLTKTDMPQRIAFTPHKATWVVLCALKKCEQDPSPFPALTQLALWGYET